MKEKSRVNRNWLLASSLDWFDSDKLSTKFIGSKIGQLARHIEVFREEYGKASFMDLQLAQLLADLLRVLKMKQEAT